MALPVEEMAPVPPDTTFMAGGTMDLNAISGLKEFTAPKGGQGMKTTQHRSELFPAQSQRLNHEPLDETAGR